MIEYIKNRLMTVILLTPMLVLSPVVYADNIERLLKEAENGDTVAQAALGLFFYERGLSKEPGGYAEALKWLLKASENGDARSQFYLYLIYSEGRETAEDPKEALRWLQSSSNLGYRKAQWQLGFEHLSGRQFPIDYEKAYVWLKVAKETSGRSDRQDHELEYATSMLSEEELRQSEKRVA